MPFGPLLPPGDFAEGRAHIAEAIALLDQGRIREAITLRGIAYVDWGQLAEQELANRAGADLAAKTRRGSHPQLA